MRRLLLALGAVAVALGMTATVAVGLAAFPEEEIGAHCAADDRIPGPSTALALSRSGVQLVAPIDGVITGWKIYVAEGQAGMEQRLQVFRPVAPRSFLAVAESEPEVVGDDGNQAFKTRIPVEQGDRFALRGTAGSFVCDPEFATSAVHRGETEVGQTYQFETRPKLAVPVRAIFELDRDGDGYGDNTQDRCDLDPTTRDGCAAIGLRIERTTVRKRSILLGMEAETKGRITAFSEIAIFEEDPDFGPGFITYLTMRNRRLWPRRTIRLALPLPEEVRDRLEALAPRRHIKARVTLFATSTEGRDATRRTTVRLHGRRDT